MITKWKVENFKSIRSQELNFGPLTIFAGANSSGKSALIQSILMISQTFLSMDSDRHLIINGPLVHLGRSSDICTIDSDYGHLKLAWECTNMNSYFQKSNSCDVTFKIYTQIGSPPLLSHCSLSKIINRNEAETEMKVLSLSLPSDRTTENNLQHYSESKMLSDLKLFAVHMDANEEKRFLEVLPAGKIYGSEINHFLPKNYIAGFNWKIAQAKVIGAAIERYAMPFTVADDHYLKFIRYSLPGYTDVDELVEAISIPRKIVKLLNEQKFLPDVYEECGITLQDWFSHVDNFINELKFVDGELELDVRELIMYKLGDYLGNDAIILEALQEEIEEADLMPIYYSNECFVELPLSAEAASITNFFEKYFRSLKFLGPIRELPRSIYQSCDDDVRDVGVNGEHTAAVLFTHAEKEITYIHPSEFDNASLDDPKQESTSLIIALREWLKYLDVAEDILVENLGSKGYDLKVKLKSSEGMQNLTQVGVGLSQLLPILVQSLLSEVDTTVIYEQPELHLHPKVQARLADYFIAMAVLGKQCIIETHSEHIINRLRLRSAAAKENNVSSLIKTYFVKKENNTSIFTELEINKYGAIENWPTDFFDQSQLEAESILRIATDKWKLEQDCDEKYNNN